MLTVAAVSDRKREVDLQVAEFIPNDQRNFCVAISHVWYDGLGNPNDNTMPHCQIPQLQELS